MYLNLIFIEADCAFTQSIGDLMSRLDNPSVWIFTSVWSWGLQYLDHLLPAREIHVRQLRLPLGGRTRGARSAYEIPGKERDCAENQKLKRDQFTAFL